MNNYTQEDGYADIESSGRLMKKFSKQPIDIFDDSTILPIEIVELRKHDTLFNSNWWRLVIAYELGDEASDFLVYEKDSFGPLSVGFTFRGHRYWYG